MGHPLIYLKEMTCPIACPDHQGGPVAVAIIIKPRTIGTLVVHRPQNGGTVLLIECIVRINEEKPPLILLVMMLPHKPDRVNSPLDPGFQLPTELLHPAGLLGLCSFHQKNTLLKQSHTGLSHPDWPYIT